MNMILNYVRVAMNVIMHSVRTAAPYWGALALLTVIFCVRRKKNKGKNRNENYDMEGVSLGMCFGMLIGAALGDKIGIGILLGMSAWLAIGTCIPKKTESE